MVAENISTPEQEKDTGRELQDYYSNVAQEWADVKNNPEAVKNNPEHEEWAQLYRTYSDNAAQKRFHDKVEVGGKEYDSLYDEVEHWRDTRKAEMESQKKAGQDASANEAEYRREQGFLDYMDQTDKEQLQAAKGVAVKENTARERVRDEEKVSSLDTAYAGTGKKPGADAEELAARDRLDKLFTSGKPEQPAPEQKIEQAVLPAEQKPTIEVVSDYGKKSAETSAPSANAVREVGQRRDVREKIGEGEIPSSVELSRLTQNERGEKSEFGEAIAVRTPQEQLRDTAKELGELGWRANRADYERAAEVYKSVTGQELAEQSRQRALEELEAQKMKVMTWGQYNTEARQKKFTAEALQDVRQTTKERSVERLWYTNSPDAKGYASLDDFKKGIEEKRVVAEKSLKKVMGKDFSLSEDSYYQLIKNGYDPYKMKARGFFGRLFSGNDIQIPSRWNVKNEMTREEFSALLANTEQREVEEAENNAAGEMHFAFESGKRRLNGLRGKCARDIMQETAGSIEQEKARVEAEKAVAEKAPKPKLEVISRIGRERTPEGMREMEKIRKQVEKDLERRKEAKSRIASLIKKQKKGDLLTAKEVAYLRSFTEQELSEAA